MILLYSFYAYLALGLVFGVWFVVRGAAQIDSQMAAASWATRLLLLPGVVALWLVLLLKQLKKTKP